jgi:hypothetical protein
MHEMPLNDVMQTMGQAQPGSAAHTEATAEYNRRQFLTAQRSTTAAILSAAAAVISAIAAWAAVVIHH